MTSQVFMDIIAAGWGVKSGGGDELEFSSEPLPETDFPFGYFFVVEIPEHAGERADMRDAVFSEDAEQADMFDQIPAGWYFLVRANDGNIYTTPCKNEASANQKYDRMMKAYAMWNTMT